MRIQLRNGCQGGGGQHLKHHENYIHVCGKGKTIAPSFVEVDDIKNNSNDYVIINICKFSTTNDLNYVGLVSPTAKLDTNICGILMEFCFMWFVEDKNLLDDIAKRFHYMVVDLKALIPMPTQKKGKKKIQARIGRTSCHM